MVAQDRIAHLLAVSPSAEDLDQRSFTRLLLACASGRALPPEVHSQIDARASSDMLAAADARAVLFAPPGTFTPSAIQAVLAWSARWPENGMAALAAGLALSSRPIVEFDEHLNDPPHQGPFRVTARLREEGLTGGTRVASRRRRARHLAAVSLLATVTGYPDPTAGAAIEYPNPVGALHEACAARGCSPPAFDVTASPDGMSWHASVTDPITCSRHDRRAVSKREAKAAAAAAALRALEPPGAH